MIGIDHIEDLAPGGVLIASERADLIKRCLAQPDERKRRARDRWLVYTEQHGPLIVARLNKTLSDPAYREEVIKHLDLSDNPALDAIHDTCAVWSQGPSRSVAGANKREASTFNALVVESMVDVHGQQWNELAEFVGPILVLPAVRKDQLRWDVLLPTLYDVVPDPEDFYGVPLAAAWPIRGTGSASRKPDVMVLDGVGWTRWRTDGGSVTQVGDVIEHGLGRFPGVPLRFDSPLDCDYFGQPSRHQRFVDATVATGAINSVLSLTRKAQNSKLLTAIGPLGHAAKEQPLDPETGIAINIEPGPGVDLPKIETLDFDTPPDNSIKHIDKYRRGVAAAYGGSLASDGRMVFDTKALAEVRKKQIPRGRVFERLLWINAVELCRKMGHPLAPQLPDPETVAAGFAVDFGQLSREFSDPKQEHEHEDWMISKGLKDQLDLLRQQGNENLDDEQLKKKLEANLENQAWFNDAVTTRNLGMTPGGGTATAAEANGALGPAVRDGTPVTVKVSGDAGSSEAVTTDDAAADTSDTPANTPAPTSDATDQQQDPAEVDKVKAAAKASDVQAESLNGSQIASFVTMSERIAAGALPLELIARFLPIAMPTAVPSVDDARELLAPLNGFVPRPIDQPAPEGAPAVPEGTTP